MKDAQMKPLLPRLLRLIGTMTEKEKIRFGRWLPADLRDKDSRIVRLWEVLSVEKEPGDVWRALFRETPYDDRKYRRLSHQLGERIEDFLAIRAFRNDILARNHYLVRSLNRRGVPDLFEPIQKKLHKQLNLQPVRNGDFYRSHMLLDLEAEHHRLLHRPWDRVSQLPGAYRYFDSWMLYERLRTACMLEAISPLNAFDLTVHDFIESLQKLVLPDNPAWEEPAVKLYVRILSLLKGELIQLEEFRELLLEAKPKMERDERINVFAILRTAYIRRIAATDTDTDYENLLELWEQMFWEGFLSQEGYIQNRTFQNILQSAMRLGQFRQRWENFLYRLPENLPPESREEGKRLLESLNFFTEGKFQACLRTLRMTIFSDLFFRIQAEMICNQCYYEMRLEETWIEERLRNLDRKLKGDGSLPEPHKETLLTGIRFFCALVRTDEKDSLEAIETELLEAKKVSDRRWLTEKIREKIEGSRYLTPKMGK
jgi:hypothetical protein